MKKQIIKYVEIVIIILLAFLLWKVSFGIIQTPQTETWWMPIGIYSLFFVFWSLGSILIKDNYLFLGASAIALFSSFVFVQNILFVLCVLFGLLILWSGRKVVQDELNSRIKISIWNSLRLERRFFVFAVALIITAQYYFGANFLNGGKKFPEIKISDKQIQLTMQFAGKINPNLFGDYKKIKTMTVDDFILFRAESNTELKKIINLSNGRESNFIKARIVKEGRKNFSDMIGYNISGNENIIGVFSKIINRKINKFLNLDIGYVDQSIPIMHWVFTGLLFLSIVSVGMLISPILIFVVWILFKIMILTNFISITKKSVEMEIIT